VDGFLGGGEADCRRIGLGSGGFEKFGAAHILYRGKRGRGKGGKWAANRGDLKII